MVPHVSRKIATMMPIPCVFADLRGSLGQAIGISEKLVALPRPQVAY